MPKANELYVGLMSGTSLDAIDVALLSFSDSPNNHAEIVATREHPFPPELRDALQVLIDSGQAVSLDQIGTLNRQLGLVYAEAVNSLLVSSATDAKQIVAIGNHGQTIRHCPDASPPFTMQIGDAATIANSCGIPTVADFRSADIAVGGQGAPLVPAFHEWAFGTGKHSGVVVNIGGISNITVLHPSAAVTGFDTGPGNTLLDGWYRRHKEGTFDRNGDWAATGTVAPQLLETLLADPYFSTPPPKSTGREHFNLNWLDALLQNMDTSASAADIQATLVELTACSIATAIQNQAAGDHVWLCGGGALNSYLLDRISARLPDMTVATTEELGIHPNWVEAAAFAWLARARLRNEAAGRPSVTGAKSPAVLGSVHLPTES